MDIKEKLNNLENMSHTDILILYKELFEEYDSLKDDELNFLSNYPNEDMWDNEMFETQKERVADIKTLYSYITTVNEYINKFIINKERV
jgi:hypothetical protein